MDLYHYISLIPMYLHRIFWFSANNLSLKYPRGLLLLRERKKNIENTHTHRRSRAGWWKKKSPPQNTIWIRWTLPIQHSNPTERCGFRPMFEEWFSIECAFLKGYSKTYSQIKLHQIPNAIMIWVLIQCAYTHTHLASMVRVCRSVDNKPLASFRKQFQTLCSTLSMCVCVLLLARNRITLWNISF